MKASFIKTNKFLPLLTDTLPYEVPVLFSNRGFYHSLQKEFNFRHKKLMSLKAKNGEDVTTQTIEDFIKNDFFNSNELRPLQEKIKGTFNAALLPYEYHITKDQDNTRKISLMHPVSQIKICDFYAAHENELLFYTNRTEVSLRHPIKKVSKIFRKHTSLLNKISNETEQTICKDIQDVLEDKGIFELHDIPNHYFVYKKYRFLHKFYDSKDFLILEQRFKFCFKFDIKRCFDSIYTHSVAWAIKGKEYAKKHIKDNCFENELDHLIQQSNWNETHGIPIGAEFSRIFAEIILQRIDQDVEDDISNKEHLIKKDVDFKICRYVDDYFVFANDEKLGHKIVNIYEQKLLNYKLFLNTEKSITLKRPFTTKHTAAKHHLLPLILKTLRNFHCNDDFTKITADNIFANARNTGNKINVLINEIRNLSFTYDVSVNDVSNICLSYIKRELIRSLRIIISATTLQKEQIFTKTSLIEKYLSDILTLSFYIFNMNPRAHTTYGMCKICFEILEILKRINNNRLTENIYYQIYSQFLLFLETKSSTDALLLEYLDILWIIQELGTKYSLAEPLLDNLLETNKQNIGYFEIMTILSYIKNNEIYDAIRINLLEIIKQKFLKTVDIFNTTETFMMFFDIIKCPFVPHKFKKNILSIAEFTKNKGKIVAFIQDRDWFFGWDEKINLKKLFDIKELHSEY